MGASPSNLLEAGARDIVWRSTANVAPDELSALKGPLLLYVYSPQCPYCQEGAPVFEKAANALPRARYNAVPDARSSDARHAAFKKAFGFAIPHYPMILGLSKAGRVVEYNGLVETKGLSNFFKALQRT